ncbi:cation channel family protein (macronuclear) [Tetrahymena thermophila SB210]|uniref:Cation channel family protein n=1 Tax=Tetrahymena thermophila (strain SB210) TaxID=312017 RepID=W7XI28_TETTS|nr:cation channel family protein [Tetrahymena thermophila SB210]EWS72924.1 cation channel family protein [Tetrahymena thermophila SB210]|eukprot:XP_012654538.1 cation channel family protein [Tetrahymena thermophila SB210]
MYNINLEGAFNRRKYFEEDKIQQKAKTSYSLTEYNTNTEQFNGSYDLYLEDNLINQDTSNVCTINQDLEQNQHFCIQKTDQCDENTSNNTQLNLSSLINKNQISGQNKQVEMSTTPKASSTILETIQKRQSKNDLSLKLISQNLKVQKNSNLNNSYNLEKSSDDYVKLSNSNEQNQNMQIKLPEFQCSAPPREQNQYKKIITFSYVYKFIREFLLRYIQRDVSYLSMVQYNIINDNTVFMEKNKKVLSRNNNSISFKNIFDKVKYLRDNKIKFQNETKCEQKQSFIQKFFQNIQSHLFNFLKNLLVAIPIISPNKFLLLIWDLLFIIFQIVFLIIYPFDISYQSLISSDILNKLQIISLFVTILDCILGFHTGIYEFGKIVMDRQKIFLEYTNKRLAYDILSICSLLSGIITDIQFFCIVSLFFRQKSIKGKFQKVIMELALKSNYSSFYDIFKLAFVILFIIHFCGCGFFLTGKLSVSYGQQEQNWINYCNLQNKSTQEQYIFSIYFIMVTMVTIGYGDIYPVNQYEKLYVIVISLVTSFVFGFSLNLIGSILTDIKKKSDDLNQKQFQIHKYLDSRNIDFSSQIRVLKYFEFLNYNEDQNIKEGQRLLQSCSKEIRDDILNEYFGNVLKKCILLKSIFSKEFLDALSLNMKERTFAPGEVIIERGEKLSQLFIVTKGEIDYHFNNKNSQKNKIELQYENTTIDIRIFFSQQPSDLSLKSRGITLASYIDHFAFIETLQNFQSDKEKYQQLRDQFIYDQIFLFPCRSCGLYKHVLNDCPQISYKVSKMRFLSKYTENVYQERNQQYVRNHKISDKSQFNTLTFSQLIKQSLKSFRCNQAKMQYQIAYPELNFEELANNEDDKAFLLNVPRINIDYYLNNQDVTQISNYCFYSDATLEYKKVKRFKQQEIEFTSSNSENDESDNVSIFQKMSQSMDNPQSQVNNSQIVNLITEQKKIVTANLAQQQDQQRLFTSDQQIPSEKKISILSNKLSNTQIPNQEEFMAQNQEGELAQDVYPYYQVTSLKDLHQTNQEFHRNQSQQQSKFNRNKQEKQKTNLPKNINPSDKKIQSRNSLTRSLKEIDIFRSGTYELENKAIQHTALQNIIELIRTSICEDLQKGNQAQNSIQLNNNKKNFNVKNNEFTHQRASKTQSIKKSFTRDSTFKNNQLSQCLLFGKCGIGFEKYKEYQNYYPKQNFSTVIKTYKKLQQQTRLKRNRANTSLNQIAANQNNQNRNKRPTFFQKKQGIFQANPQQIQK